MAATSHSMIVARIASTVGACVLLSSAALNAFTVGIWRGEAGINYRDVYAIYGWTALVLGLALIALGRLVARADSLLLARLGLVTVVFSLAVCADRLLLVYFGRTLWTYHSEAHFQHRPGAVRRTRHDRNTLWRINSHGYHDDEFPTAKPEDEFRCLIVGDSLTMGFTLPHEQTYPQVLEDLLETADALHSSHQVINAGIAGYTVFQETITAREGLRFAPDMLMLGFCMNDLTEPFTVQREFGGTGIDYHEVTQTSSPLAGYLLNETGLGRLGQYLSREESSIQTRKRTEDYNVRDMVAGLGSDSRYDEAWRQTRAQLEEFYALAREQDLPVLLVVFPYHFQVFDEAACEPQRLIVEHAESQGVEALDLTPVFRELILDPELLAQLGAGASPAEMQEAHAERLYEYYLDSNHFSAVGHRVVAEQLFEYLVGAGLAETGVPAEADE